MKPENSEDLFELIDGYVLSAAVGAAMELGLFWYLAEKPLPVIELAKTLDIPYNRCHFWLQLLSKHGLLEETAGGFTPSAVAREAILKRYDRDTWSFLAQESRERFPAVVNLAENIRKPKSVWELQGLTSPGYFKQIMADPGYAERFTRMLYRLHLRFAENIASSLDFQGVIRLMDLGGGSGVVSMALLRRYPLLKSVVVDVENVCLAGRRIAVDNHLERRITYHPADFQQDELPEGFDRVLYCDVGVYDEALFRRIHKTLNPGGHLVIVGRFATDPARGIPSTLVWGFLGSLEYPSGFVHFATLESIQEQLRNAGFSGIISYSLPAQEVLRWEEEWSIVEACKTASECI